MPSTFLTQTQKFHEVIHFTLYLEQDPSWLLQDATFEKMGALMSDNSGRLIGLYDELSSFLTRINHFRGRGLSDTHELAMFLELYNANEWTRTTGKTVSFGAIYTSLCPITKCTLHMWKLFWWIKLQWIINTSLCSLFASHGCQKWGMPLKDQTSYYKVLLNWFVWLP